MLTPKTARQVWAVVFSTADAGPLNQLVEIKSEPDLTPFGNSPLTRAVSVLLRYGAFVLAVRYDDPASFDLLDSIEETGKLPHLAVLPGGPDFEAFADRCLSNSILGIVDYIGTTEDLLEERGDDVGYGVKSPYLAITFPAVTRGEEVEFLSCHLGGLICRAVQLDGPVSGEPIKGATGITVAILPEDSDRLIQSGIVTVGPDYTIRGFANSAYSGEPSQDSLLMRPVIEAIILKDVRRFLASRIGTPVNLTTARVMANEISVYLAGRSDIAGGFATLVESESTFTDTSAHLVYTLTVALTTGTSLSTQLRFEP